MVLATILGLMVLFAIVAILSAPSDARHASPDPRDDLNLWTWVGRR